LEGHRASTKSVREIVEACGGLGIGYLTLYTFSAENWTRPPAEVSALMALIRETLAHEIAELHQKNVRVRHLGRREDLPAELLGELDRAAALTAGNAGLRLQLAINYGGRQEIVEAATGLAREVASGAVKPEQITEADFVRHLHYPEMPDPDVLIRTGGDLRVSNYLLWQIAYAEIYVTATLWPDFRKRHLYEALLDYQGRQRRFGGVEGEGSG
jgi:undecaprenyl diphosphate synthase